MTYEIVCTRGPMKGRRWKVTPNGLKIGRDKSCEIQVVDLSAELFHCIVKMDDGKPVVLNLASSRGVDVNGTNVDEAELDPTDRIRIGGEWFIVLASGRKKGGSIAGKIIPLAIVLGIAAGVAYFYRQYNDRAERDIIGSQVVFPMCAWCLVLGIGKRCCLSPPVVRH